MTETMSFSNPAGMAREAAAQYTAALLELLGDREPLTVLGELVGFLERTLAEVEPDRLRVPERPGKWSIHQVVWHLADSELVSRYRLRLSVAQSGAPITGYDQDAWARELRYADADIEDAMEQIRVLRAANLRWIGSLEDEELDRFGMHEERGKEPVRRLIALLAAHDLVHRNQIRRIRAAIGA